MAQSNPTLQGVFGIIEDMRPTLQLLAWADNAPELKAVTMKSPNFADPNLFHAAETFLHRMPKRGVLPALEKAVEPLSSPADRSALVRQIADTVESATRKRPLQV